MADRLPRRVRVVGVKRMIERRPFATVAVLATLLSMAGSQAPSHSSVADDANPWEARESAAKSAGVWDDSVGANRWVFAPANVDELLRRFAADDYDIANPWANPGRGLGVPRLFLSALPTDLAQAEAAATLKQGFIASLLPLILRRNEEIAADRERLLRLAEIRRFGMPLDDQDSEWLADIAEQYGAAPDDFATLKWRVDVVPASLALAQAAEESGWGRSRVAKAGHALFGQYSWQGGAVSLQGSPTSKRPPSKRFKIRMFTGLESAVASYMHNLNSNPAYREFRDRRAWLRAAGKTPGGLQLVDSIGRYSTRGVDYIGAIRAIIQSNALHKFDAARLRDDTTVVAQTRN